MAVVSTMVSTSGAAAGPSSAALKGSGCGAAGGWMLMETVAVFDQHLTWSD